MNKIIYSRFDKTKIADLPRVTFPGRIVTILSAGEAEKAVDFLLKSDILGFDTETRPCFTKGKRNKVALLQVSNREICFLFRLNSIGLAPAIVRLLETEGPLKVGLSWHDDIRSLHERGEFEPRGFIDLQDHMIELGIKDMSLAKLCQPVPSAYKQAGAVEQLGSRCTHRKAEGIWCNRCMGMYPAL